ncbi:MAG: hypothetical protein KDK39_02175 [Leptospiraceae bacterium]|nr:hypothetical protein [Leptospiraceae bacterium]
MSAPRYILVRFRAASMEGDVVWIALEVDLGGKKILQKLVGAGSQSKFDDLSLGSDYDSFKAAFQEVQYYGNLNPQLTTDVEQFIRRLTANYDFIAQLLRCIEKQQFDSISYQIQAELEHIMATRNLQIQSDLCAFEPPAVEEQDIKEAPQAANRLKMKFVISPFNGIIIPRLSIPQKIFATFADPKDKHVRSWLKANQLDNAPDPGAQIVTLRGLDQVPRSNSIIATVELADGTLAEIDEDSYLLKVKTLAEVRRKKKQSSTLLQDFDTTAPGFVMMMAFVVVVSLLIGIIATLFLAG